VRSRGITWQVIDAPHRRCDLACMATEQAGAASGALTTAQYVGSALGVALVGIAYFGGLSSGFAAAFEHGLWVLVGALALVAVLSRRLP
jgi:energy-converting hydrogenase Eha subunit H